VANNIVFKSTNLHYLEDLLDQHSVQNLWVLH